MKATPLSAYREKRLLFALAPKVRLILRLFAPPVGTNDEQTYAVAVRLGEQETVRERLDPKGLTPRHEQAKLCKTEPFSSNRGSAPIQ